MSTVTMIMPSGILSKNVFADFQDVSCPGAVQISVGTLSTGSLTFNILKDGRGSGSTTTMTICLAYFGPGPMRLVRIQ